MPVTKATRDVLDLALRPVVTIDVNCSGGTNLVDNVQIGTRVANLGYFTNVRANNVQINAGGVLDLSLSGVTVLGKLRAYYADIAERYEADGFYKPGTVLQFGGEKEVTLARDARRVIGVVTSSPFIMLNSGLTKIAEYCPAIALTGRVPCMMIGPVEAGDLVVLSDTPGVGKAIAPEMRSHKVFGRVIKTDLDQHERLVEIKVGK